MSSVECYYCQLIFDDIDLTDDYHYICQLCLSDNQKYDLKIALVKTDDLEVNTKLKNILKILDDITNAKSQVESFFNEAKTAINVLPLPLDIYKESQLKSLALLEEKFTTIRDLLIKKPSLAIPEYHPFIQPLRLKYYQNQNYLDDNTFLNYVLSHHELTWNYNDLCRNEAIALDDLITCGIPLAWNCICLRTDLTEEIITKYLLPRIVEQEWNTYLMPNNRLPLEFIVEVQAIFDKRNNKDTDSESSSDDSLDGDIDEQIPKTKCIWYNYNPWLYRHPDLTLKFILSHLDFPWCNRSIVRSPNITLEDIRSQPVLMKYFWDSPHINNQILDEYSHIPLLNDNYRIEIDENQITPDRIFKYPHIKLRCCTGAKYSTEDLPRLFEMDRVTNPGFANTYKIDFETVIPIEWFDKYETEYIPMIENGSITNTHHFGRMNNITMAYLAKFKDYPGGFCFNSHFAHPNTIVDYVKTVCPLDESVRQQYLKLDFLDGAMDLPLDIKKLSKCVYRLDRTALGAKYIPNLPTWDELRLLL